MKAAEMTQEDRVELMSRMRYEVPKGVEIPADTPFCAVTSTGMVLLYPEGVPFLLDVAPAIGSVYYTEHPIPPKGLPTEAPATIHNVVTTDGDRCDFAYFLGDQFDWNAESMRPVWLALGPNGPGQQLYPHQIASWEDCS